MRTLSDERLAAMHAYWRAANYLTVGEIYLQANPLLRETLRREHIKPRLLGHWGTSPGLSFTLEHFAGRVSDSGEGRWTLDAAIDEAVPAPVLAAALFERCSSRGEAEFQDQLLSAMRFEFGGHVEKGGT